MSALPPRTSSSLRKIRAAVCGFKGRTVGNDNIEVEHSEQSEEVKNMLNQIVANSFLFVGLLPAFRDELIKITLVVYLPGENATTQARSYSCVPFFLLLCAASAAAAACK